MSWWPHIHYYWCVPPSTHLSSFCLRIIIGIICNHLWESLLLWKLFYLCKSYWIFHIVKIFLYLFFEYKIQNINMKYFFYLFFKFFFLFFYLWKFLFIYVYLWKSFFYLCSSVGISFIKYILETSVLKCIFRGSNFKVHLCSEMHFLREQLFQSSDLWLLISVAVFLCFFIKVFTTSKIFAVLTCINTSLGL